MIHVYDWLADQLISELSQLCGLHAVESEIATKLRRGDRELSDDIVARLAAALIATTPRANATEGEVALIKLGLRGDRTI